MDQRAHTVDQDLRNILHTRAALTEKIELLRKEIDYGIEVIKSTALKAVDNARDASADFIKLTVVQTTRHQILFGSAIIIGLGILSGWRKYKRWTRADSDMFVVP